MICISLHLIFLKLALRGGSPFFAPLTCSSTAVDSCGKKTAGNEPSRMVRHQALQVLMGKKLIVLSYSVIIIYQSSINVLSMFCLFLSSVVLVFSITGPLWSITEAMSTRLRSKMLTSPGCLACHLNIGCLMFIPSYYCCYIYILCVYICIYIYTIMCIDKYLIVHHIGRNIAIASYSMIATNSSSVPTVLFFHASRSSVAWANAVAAFLRMNCNTQQNLRL